MGEIRNARCLFLQSWWLQYADHPVDPICRSWPGSITPIMRWILYADHQVAPLGRSLTYEKMWTGWGLTTRPKIPGMESVDNAYLGMALQHGVLAPGLFALILAYAILSQIRFGLHAPPHEPPIGFTFSGIYLMCGISFATVFMGAQTEPMIFLLLGWGESIKQRREELLNPDTSQPTAPTGPFRRIMY